MEILNTLFLNPFINLLFFLYRIFGNDLGLAVIGLTVIFKLVTLPLNIRMLSSQRRMQQLKPKLDKLKEQHGKDKMALAQAQMELYKLEGVSPTGSCLPMLLQIPFLYGLFQSLRFVLGGHSVEELNAIFYSDWLHLQSIDQINLGFFWIDNLSHPDPLYILPILAAISQFILSKMMSAPKSMLPKPKDTGEASLENSLMAAQGQMIYLFPIMTFFINLYFPAALSLYWTAGNIFSIIQQIYVNKKNPIIGLNQQGIPVPVSQLESESPSTTDQATTTPSKAASSKKAKKTKKKPSKKKK